MIMALLMIVVGSILFIIGIGTNLGLISFIICLVGVFIFFSPFLLCDTYGNWIASKDTTHPVITLKQFITYYNAAPYNWILSRYYTIYKGDVVDFKTFFDTIGYRMLLKKIRKREAKEEQLKSQLKFIKSVQKDINKQYEDITEFVKEGVIR